MTFPAAVHHVAITVTDLEASRAWYQRLLDAVPVIDEEMPALAGHHKGFHHTVFQLTGGIILALHAHPDTDRAHRSDELRPGLDHIGFTCSDRAELERQAARLDELGIRHGGIADDALGHGLAFRDPDNVALELWAPRVRPLRQQTPTGRRRPKDLVSTSIDAVLQSAVENGAAPNLVGVAADHDGVIYEGAAGPLAAGGDQPVGADSIFRIASMTKTVCAVAALQQRERGNLDFDAPVDTYCPDFAAVQVLDGFDRGKPRLRAPARRATVRQLLTHTAGLPYSFWNADIVRWEAAGGPKDAPRGLTDAFASPMVADPGTRFDYGVGFDWLGRVVEEASGQPLDDYLAEHVLDPLGMHATAFRISDDERARCVPVHVEDDAGNWVTTDIDWDRRPDWWSGGHGLYSTPRDYLRFQQMLLGGGTLAGTTILDRSSVRDAFTNQIGDLRVPAEMRTTNPARSHDFVVGPDKRWGWGLLLATTRQPGMRASGSGSWTGIFNTNFWVDPHTGITGALYTQALPFAAPAVLEAYAAFERALYEVPRT